jgi:hypothetical protein
MRGCHPSDRQLKEMRKCQRIEFNAGMAKRSIAKDILIGGIETLGLCKMSLRSMILQ